MNIYAIHPSKLESKWDEIAPFIQKGLDYANNEMDVLDAHSMIEDGDLIPLVVEEDNKILSVLTLELIDRPQKRILGVMTAGGSDMSKWLDQIVAVVDAIAKEQQANSISISGRRGWLRTLEKHKYTHLYTVLTKEVN